MSLLVNLQELEHRDVEVAGELTPEELDYGVNDETIAVTQTLKYSLNVQLLEDALLVRGQLHLDLDCRCVRCLVELSCPIDFQDWICHIPISGEEKAPINKGCVDLTPYIREDTLLAFPQHPLCRKDCPGLSPKDSNQSEGASKDGDSSSPWDQLNQLKL